MNDRDPRRPWDTYFIPLGSLSLLETAKLLVFLILLASRLFNSVSNFSMGFFKKKFWLLFLSGIITLHFLYNIENIFICNIMLYFLLIVQLFHNSFEFQQKYVNKHFYGIHFSRHQALDLKFKMRGEGYLTIRVCSIHVIQ